MTDTNNPLAVTPEKVQELLDSITQGYWENDNSRLFSLIISEANIICKIMSDNIKTHDADANLIAAAPSVFREYLKLHEENAALKAKLLDEQGKDCDGCEAHWKAFKEENTRYKKALEHYAGSYIALGETARNALKDTK